MNEKSIFSRLKFGHSKVPNFKTSILITTGLVLLHSVDASAQGRMVLNGGVVVNLHGGSSSTPINMVVDNSATNAISTSGGGRINSEGQFNVLQWNVEDGAGNYVVPFADNAGNPLPVSLNVATAGSNDGALRFAMYGTTQDNLPLPVGVTSLEHQDIIGDGLPPPAANGDKVYDRYWFIASDGYTTNPEGTMGFSYSTSSMSGDLVAGNTQMAAQSHDGTAWSVSQFGSDNLTGSVTGVPFSSTSFNSTWTLVENGAPLPITLLTFNAVWADSRQSQARVFWATASEENNEYFDVQRSADGSTWTNIDRLQGAGTSINTLNYQILDKNQGEIAVLRDDLVQKINSLAFMENTVVSLTQQTEEYNREDQISLLKSKTAEIKLLTEENWNDFKRLYGSAYPKFLESLIQQKPNVSSGEQRLACMMRLNLTTYELADMTGVSHESVKKSLLRFKKKMEYDTQTELTDFIFSLPS